MCSQQQQDRAAPKSSIGAAVKQGRKWWGWAGILVLVACALLYYNILLPGLEPCAWLDVAIKRSGCFRVLEMHEVLEGHGFNIDFAFSDNGTTLASSSLLHGGIGEKGGTKIRTSVEWWQVSDDEFLPLLEWTTEPIEGMALSPDGNIVALAAWNGIHLWEISPQQGWSSEVFAPVTATDIVFSPDGVLLASRQGAEVQLWRVLDHTLSQTLQVQGEGRRGDMAFSPDGTVLAVGGNSRITLWAIADGRPIRELPEGYSPITFSKDGTTLGAVANALQIYLWRVSDGTLLRKLEGHSTTITSIAFSPKGEILASVSGQEMSLWHVADGKLLRAIELQADAVAFSPDGILAVKMKNGTVGLWRVSEE
jgi:WD40 repeat protein